MKTLYAIAVFIFSVLLLGTAGAVEQGMITFGEALWQIGISMAAGLWFWNLLRIEENRSCRKGRMN